MTIYNYYYVVSGLLHCEDDGWGCEYDRLLKILVVRGGRESSNLHKHSRLHVSGKGSEHTGSFQMMFGHTWATYRNPTEQYPTSSYTSSNSGDMHALKQRKRVTGVSLAHDTRTTVIADSKPQVGIHNGFDST